MRRSSGQARVLCAILSMIAATAFPVLVWGSETRIHYSHNTPMDRILDIAEDAGNRLRSESSYEVFGGLKTLSDLSWSARFYSPIRHSLYPCPDVPPEFSLWSREVLQILRDHIGQSLEPMLKIRQSSQAQRALQIAGRIRLDAEVFRTLALEYLRSGDTQLLFSARTYFGGLGDPGVEAVLELLPGEDSTQRHTLFQAISAAGSFSTLRPELVAAVTDSIIGALFGSDPDVAETAAYAIRRPGLDPERIIPALVTATRSPFPHVCGASLEALLCHDEIESLYFKELYRCLGNPEPRVSIAAMKILGRIADADSLLIQGLDHKARETRLQAMAMLGKRNLPDEQIVDLAIKGLAIDVAPWAAAKICEGLGPRAEKAWRPLEQTLSLSPNSFCRNIVLRAMVSVDEGGERAIAALRREWAGSSELERQSLIQIMHKMGSRSLPLLPEIEGVLSNPKDGGYRNALELIRLIGPDASNTAPLVAEGLYSEREWIRKDALEALIALGEGLCLVKDEVEAVSWDVDWDPELRSLAGEVLLHLECPE